MSTNSRKSTKKSRKSKRQKAIRNRIIFALVLIIAIIAVIFAFNKGGKNPTEGGSNIVNLSSINNDNSFEATESATLSSAVSSTPSSSTVSKASSSISTATNGKTTDISGDYRLILVNTTNLLPLNYSPSVSPITAKYVSPVGLKFDSRAVDSLNKLLADAHADGVNLIVISAYRTMSKQTSLYNNAVERQKAAHPEYSDDKAKAEAAKSVAIPGTSEHQLGLAADFNSVESNFESTKEYKWLKANAAKYGFVNRYPSDKSNITGIIYEPWHWRFVGVEHANKMNELGLCLEEYVEYLKK